MRRVSVPWGSSESSLPPQTLVESLAALGLLLVSARVARWVRRSARSRRPGGSPWIISSSASSDSSKVSRWRPGIPHFGVSRKYVAILRRDHGGGRFGGKDPPCG